MTALPVLDQQKSELTRKWLVFKNQSDSSVETSLTRTRPMAATSGLCRISRDFELKNSRYLLETSKCLTKIPIFSIAWKLPNFIKIDWFWPLRFVAYRGSLFIIFWKGNQKLPVRVHTLLLSLFFIWHKTYAWERRPNILYNANVTWIQLI